MPKDRLYFVDNLRIMTIILVVTLHLSITYGGIGSWYYRNVAEGYVSIPLTWYNGTVQAFSMGLFFLIAGYFTPVSYERKGARQFIKDRLLRLGIPILCYDFVIGPLMVYPLVHLQAMEPGRVRPALEAYWAFLGRYYSGFHVGTGPLWFAEALLLLSAGYVLGRRFLNRPAPPAQASGPVPGHGAIACVALGLTAATFVVRLWLPIGWNFEPLNFQFPFFPQYICMFVVGIAAYRRNWLARIPEAMGKLWCYTALLLIGVLYPVLFTLGGALQGKVSVFTGGLHWQCLGYAAWEQFTGVALIVTLLSISHRRFNRQTGLGKAMSAGAYTVYIIHAPVVVLVALFLRHLGIHPLVKFVLAAGLAVPLCFALAHVIRRLPLARRIL